MNLGEIAGWSSVALGQLVSWRQVLKLRRERGDGVSLASYAIVTVSMSLFFMHAVAIGDAVSMASVPVSMVPNVLIAVTLVRRRRHESPEASPVGALPRTDRSAGSRRSMPAAARSTRATPARHPRPDVDRVI